MAKIIKNVPITICASVLLWMWAAAGTADGAGLASNKPAIAGSTFKTVVQTLAAFGDRSTGTPGCEAAADYILSEFQRIGLESVGTQLFAQPVMKHDDSRIVLTAQNQSIPLDPLSLNAITPQAIAPEGIKGPLIYAGSGSLVEFNGKPVAGAVVLMDIDSGKNWLNAASLGAKALIYIDRPDTVKMLYDDKMELSPIHFPRFRMMASEVRKWFGDVGSNSDPVLVDTVQLTSRAAWRKVTARNVYGLIPGTDPQLREQAIVVEAFYDSTAYVPGRSPGADQACGIASLLALAEMLIKNPPGRSVLLVATAGHAQTLAGMREMIWSIEARSRDQRQMQKSLQKTLKAADDSLALLKEAEKQPAAAYAKRPDRLQRLLLAAINDRLKTEVDRISRRLMRLRLETPTAERQAMIQDLAAERVLLRRLVWRTDLLELTPAEAAALEKLIPLAVKDLMRIRTDVRDELDMLKSSRKFRSVAKSMDIATVVSLHLSSHGDGFGAFNYGWLHLLRQRVNRVPDYSTLDDVLRRGVETMTRQTQQPKLYRDTLRPSRLRSWQSYFLDQPPLGGEISALAGYIGWTFVTVNDARPHWGTPGDRAGRIDWKFAGRQSQQISFLVHHLSYAPRLHSGSFPRDGFTNIDGNAQFLRHGELFADQAAPGTVIMAFQGSGRFYAMVDSLGKFYLKGVSTKKLTQDKVIIEGYKFDPDTGDVVWAIDKPKTGKDAYRLKIIRSNVETDLIMFGARQTTLFNLLEPRNFHYMTKIQLIDARREATPVHYWWSRIDTRASNIASMYLEPGTRMKLTLSDSVLNKKLILLNASQEHPQGRGYLVDKYPQLYRTEYKVARDMWALLVPRIANLEKHGVYNQRISELKDEGLQALQTARKAMDDRRYDQFYETATQSWALASRVYNDIESTQKDVLFGVLFYIALFVPFAFCMERLLFSFTHINKRIVAFCGLLLLLIAVIYNVHPAFQLAYSPTVVILAFFIMGLSLIVTLIIYFRFEEEMNNLQRRVHQTKASEIGRWKAFTAAFLLGVSNLRRRRLRTALTCITLMILTFTIMSFTSVKSVRHHASLLFQPESPYNGFLMKNADWRDLPIEATEIIANHFRGEGVVAPRVWLEHQDRTRALRVAVKAGSRKQDALGIVGLSTVEPSVTGIDRILIRGRWPAPGERNVILLPDRMADHLGIDLNPSGRNDVTLWGLRFRVVGIFSGAAMSEAVDLDGEPLTPVTFPSEVVTEMTEVEMEALESGEDVSSFQSRYQHIDADLVVIVPVQTLLSLGGRLKSMAVRPPEGIVSEQKTERLVDRFGLMLFAGKPDGTFLYHASDTMSYSGVPNVVIPVVISILIVLNTMIGSVYERKQEIGIYTSVGLAPSHVSFLFIAEALAFAVLSVVLGYLLAQTTASAFAGTQLWSGITVNYSSLAGVAAMVLVILVVLISVIYPSRVAGKIAIPDVNRSWKMPEPVENRIELTLPFLMTPKEHLSIGGYLLEHFDGHRDISHGLFSAGKPTLSLAPCRNDGDDNRKEPPPSGPSSRGTGGGRFLELTVDIWLAPFDFGIMQKVVIAFCRASDNPDYLEVRIRLERQAGEANSWQRINKAFLYDLRKQLLIWRSLDTTEKDAYESMLLAQGKRDAFDLGRLENRDTTPKPGRRYRGDAP